MSILSKVLSDVISKETGLTTTIHETMDGHIVTLSFSLGHRPNPDTFHQRYKENFKDILFGSSLFQEVRVNHDKETKELRVKIEKLEKEISELIPYKHYAQVQKEISGSEQLNKSKVDQNRHLVGE